MITDAVQNSPARSRSDKQVSHMHDEHSLGRIAVLGPFIVDVLGRPVSEIPPGQGGILLEEIRMTVAGTGGGAAIDLAALGWNVDGHGAIGRDALGTFLRSQLANAGIGATGIVEKDGVQTSATILPIRANGERPSMHVPGATRYWTHDDLDAAALENVDALLVGGPDTMPDVLSPEGIGIIERFRATGRPVFVDLLRSDAASNRADLMRLLAHVDWFTPNDDQLRSLTGVNDLTDAAEMMLAAGVGTVAVTTGAKGALLVRRGHKPVVVPAYPTTVVDTTGCGDAFNSGVITGVLSGAAPQDAVSLGNACGALVATGLGSDAGITALADVLTVVASDNAATTERLESRIRELSTGRQLAARMPEDVQ